MHFNSLCFSFNWRAVCIVNDYILLLVGVAGVFHPIMTIVIFPSIHRHTLFSTLHNTRGKVHTGVFFLTAKILQKNQYRSKNVSAISWNDLDYCKAHTIMQSRQCSQQRNVWVSITNRSTHHTRCCTLSIGYLPVLIWANCSQYAKICMRLLFIYSQKSSR